MALSEQFGGCVSCCIVALVALIFLIDIDFSAFLCYNSSNDKNEQSGIIPQVTRQLKQYSTLYVKFRQIQAPVLILPMNAMAAMSAICLYVLSC